MSIDDLTSSEPGLRLSRSRIGTSPVFSHVWEDHAELNARLRQVVLDKMAVTPGLKKSNCGGWQSERDLQLWGDPAIDELLDRMRAMLRSVVRETVVDPEEELLDGWDIEAWANVNQLGDDVAAHVHGGGVNMWAAVYYVDCGQSPDAISSGFTHFLDMSGTPRPISRRAPETSGQTCAPAREAEDLRVEPLPGKMVVFPATLPHYVTAYQGNEKRITIALNLRHTGFVVTDFENHYSRRRTLWRNYRGPMLMMYEAKRVVRETLAAVVPVHRWPAGLRRRLLGGSN
ncbi:putative 2OG-Fe(II) oxygenase [Pseudonocardia acaciae]|uniref:putative 2OG-Fe(II) oxygenase n=1 Tax=Pseudonocardia acaciae TaxID=551276 RepID=UPI00146FF3E2|nr:putative 2OG-Fe(II) oxygenase [Pseudonocardia acaciae]